VFVWRWLIGRGDQFERYLLSASRVQVHLRLYLIHYFNRSITMPIQLNHWDNSEGEIEVVPRVIFTGNLEGASRPFHSQEHLPRSKTKLLQLRVPHKSHLAILEHVTQDCQKRSRQIRSKPSKNPV
jgi:hypothetical protein